jgi:ribosomal protein L24E
MNSENKTHHHSVSERCLICGKSIEPGHGALRINHHGNTVNLCNPDCLRIFAQEPDPYLARLAKRIREQQLQESLKSEKQKSAEDEGFLPEADYQLP